MAPKVNQAKIETLKMQPRDKSTDDEHSNEKQTQLSGSVEVYDTQPDQAVTRPQTRVGARVMQTQAQTVSPSQSYKECNERTGSSMP